MEKAIRDYSEIDFDAGEVSSRIQPIGSEPVFAGRPFAEYESVVDWFLESKPSTSWQKNCTKYLLDYCTFVGKDPDTLLSERKSRLRADPDDRTDEKQLARWHQKLLGEASAGYALAKFTAVVSFFKWNHKPLGITKFPTVGPEQRREFRRLRKEEVQRLLAFASTYRAKNMLMIDGECGLRARHLQMLELGHLVVEEDGSKEGVSAKHWRDLAVVKPPCRIQLPRKCYYGRKKAGITFVCRDAVNTLVESLKLRETAGEALDAHTPIFPVYVARLKVSDTGSHMQSFLSEWHPVGSKVIVRHPTLKPRRSVEAIVENITVRKASVQQLEYDMRVLRKRAGLQHNPEEEQAASLHGLRKYCRSSLDAAGVNSVLANVFIGHSNAVEEHYSGVRHLDLAELREGYELAMSRLAITEDSGPRVSSLERKLQQMEARNRFLEDQLPSITEQLNEVQRQMRHVLASRST